MKRYLLVLLFLSKRTLASLQHPNNPYIESTHKNYIYERACHHYASEFSTARYEGPQVRSRVFNSLYSKCLDAVWPDCEVESAGDMIVVLDSHKTFEVERKIVYNIARKPIKYAHKRGFFAENLLEPEHRCFIFWDPLEPKTDISTFYNIKFANLQTLFMAHLTMVTKTIKKYRGAGVESPNQLYLKENLPNRKFILVMSYGQLRNVVEACLNKFKKEGLLPTLAQGSVDDLKRLLTESLPKTSFTMTVFKKNRSEERIHFLHPLYTVINPPFPIAIAYVPSLVTPITYTRDLTNRSFIAAAFDEVGALLSEPVTNAASYLVISFNSIKLV